MNERQRKQLAHVATLAAVGELTRSVTHQFNNMLAVVSGNLELLEEHKNGALDAETAAMIHDAATAADDGIRFVRGLNEMMPGAAPTEDLLDLGRHVAEFGDVIRLLVRGRVTVDVHVADKPLHVMGDNHVLTAALLFLVLNARDAMPDGGSICLSIDEIPAGYAAIEVTDTGCGMSASVTERCTEWFFTTKGAARSAGLGLSVVEDFAKGTSGKLVIQSVEGEGTRVALQLPLVSQDG